MAYNKFILQTLVFAVLTATTIAQELNCQVEIDTRSVQGVDKSVFETMKTAVYEFMNNRTWTNYQYEDNEHIDCSILITINEAQSTGDYKATLTMALIRPVFNSSYNSPLLNYIDKDFDFQYIENEPLDFYPTTFTSNLTAVLAFYAYIFIGLDFDSFLQEGGNPFFEIAQEIVNTAQNSNYIGWKSFENQRNRYWLIENLMNPAYKPIRDFYYNYHRKGLDLMYDNAEIGRKTITSSLKTLQDVKKVRPGLLLLQIIADAKRDEIIGVFSKGVPAEKQEVFNIMKEIDPSHVTEYQKIMGN